MSRQTRIYCAADLHGSELVMRKFINAAKFYEADLIIAAGDLTGKAMVPVVQKAPGRYEALVGSRIQEADANGVDRMEERIRLNGFYPFRCAKDTYDQLCQDLEFREKVFTEAMAEGLHRWVRTADERLAGTGIRCLAMPGNDDGFFFEEVLSQSTIIVNHDSRVVDLGEFQILGFGPSNQTPWRTHRELDEPEIEQRLDELSQLIDPDKPLILNTHVPPFDSGLDTAPKLREDFSLVIEGGEVVMKAVGSTAVRDFIHRHSPFLSLHGHIHESRGAVRIGKTLAINPGSEYNSGVLRGAIVTIRREKVLSYQLVSG